MGLLIFYGPVADAEVKYVDTALYEISKAVVLQSGEIIFEGLNTNSATRVIGRINAAGDISEIPENITVECIERI
jgi:hypothetical protein